MKYLTLKVSVLTLVATLTAGAFSSQATTFNLDTNSRIGKMLQTAQPVREFRGEKPWTNPGEDVTAKMNRRLGRRAPGMTTSAKFDGLNNFSFIEGPDGSTWFYTAEYDYKTVDFGNGYSEDQIVAYTFKIYDTAFQEIGTIRDDVTFGPGETRVASAVLDPAVSTKFFNTDARPEVMVYMAMNTGPEQNYKVNYYNKVYSIGGDKEGENDVCIAQIPGRCVDSFNAAVDSWSENFYYTFVEDIVPDPDGEYDTFVDFVNAYKTHVTIYKKAGWEGGPTPIFNYDIQLVCIPGDTTDGIYFISKDVNGVPYFIFSRYEKPYFVDPTGFAQDESATPDNALIIDVFSYPNAYAETLESVSTTRLPVEERKVDGELNYTFYSIGSIAWKNDIDMSVNGTPQAPAFIVARDFTKASDLESMSSSYDIYDNKGNHVLNLAENTDGIVLFSDIPGLEPQAMFVTLNGSEKYEFAFVDLYSGNLVMTLDQSINGEPISATGDRVSTGNGTYKYAFIMSFDEVDEDGNELPRVAWINTDGTLDHIDRINVGKNVARATINLNQAALTPYLYDTDPGVEYAVLVGRYVTGSTSTVKNEFVIVDDNGDRIATFSESDGRGLPYLFTVIYDDNRNRLQMVYNDNYTYNIDVYDLPFTMMAGGDGSAANPYQIASVGDLQLIKLHPAANYRVVNDFDAAGFEFSPISSFTGTLDGDGHTISNLYIKPGDSYTGMFGMVEPGATVKNLTFIEPVVNPSGSSYGGLIAGYCITLNIDNVHVYGLNIDSTFGGVFGGLVGQATVGSSITSSSLHGCNISLPNASDVGGLVGNARTGLHVAASAFSGNIEGRTSVGGIIGESISADDNVKDCHVDATIKARNNVGGIIGLSNRAPIIRCYVEGEITATEPERWSNAYAAGGIVGSLAPYFGSELEVPVIISGNIVALRSLNAPGIENVQEDYPGQTATVHRIVGYSVTNENSSTSAANETEQGLAANYALASLAPFSSAIEPTAVSTEGESIDAISREFLDETLGYSFGTSTDEPWHIYTDTDPRLYFETSYVVVTSAIKTVEGENFDVTLRFLDSKEITLDEVLVSFLCEYDNTIIEMTDNATMTDNVLTIGFIALKEGTTTINFNINSEESAATVEVAKAQHSGVENIATDAEVTLTWDGATLYSPGALIEVYNLTGIKVAAGTDAINVTALGRGHYIGVATTPAGRKAIHFQF
ncbi:MAG: hypothetical protein J1E63_04035 [Muribaculaceae bacterium]|nr:hypothetical protein [Muribaculaceae bacterium]